MPSFDLSDNEQVLRSQKIAKLETINNGIYESVIPSEMHAKYLNEIYEAVFGVDIMEIYLNRNVFEAKSIIISDFSTNGFFWAQVEEEIVSNEFKDMYERVNVMAQSKKELADLNVKWCVAKFQGEWFRGYVQEVMANKKLKIFFIDYGTFELVDHEDTRELDDEAIWEIHPLAIPCVLKDIKLSQINGFKKLHYQTFLVKKLKMIEKSCIFEIELVLENGESLLSVI